jgi:hypothetical protein
MISTGDTASVLTQHTSRTVSASGLPEPHPGQPCPVLTHLTSPPTPPLRAAARAHRLKG